MDTREQSDRAALVARIRDLSHPLEPKATEFAPRLDALDADHTLGRGRQHLPR